MLENVGPEIPLFVVSTLAISLLPQVHSPRSTMPAVNHLTSSSYSISQMNVGLEILIYEKKKPSNF